MTDINIAYNTDYSHISNQYNTTTNKGNCSNQFGNYFKTCNNISAQWGNSTESKDLYVSMNDKPCHNLFNNSTKRKSIVFYSR